MKRYSSNLSFHEAYPRYAQHCFEDTKRHNFHPFGSRRFFVAQLYDYEMEGAKHEIAESRELSEALMSMLSCPPSLGPAHSQAEVPRSMESRETQSRSESESETDSEVSHRERVDRIVPSKEEIRRARKENKKAVKEERREKRKTKVKKKVKKRLDKLAKARR